MATEKHGGEIIFRRQQFDIDGSTITYDRTKPNGAEQVGLWCSLSDDMEIQLAADGDELVGKLTKVQANGLGVVDYDAALIKVNPGASVTLVRGRGLVGALGASSARGYVRNPVLADTEAGRVERLIARGTVLSVAGNLARFSY